MPKIDQEVIKQTAIPLCPGNEQQTIDDIVEDQLAVIDHVAADLEAKLKSSQSLRLSILRHAFTGQLVPQDPSNESASELLKRIGTAREEFAKQAQALKKTKPKTKPKAPRKRDTKKV
jgi:type I restriction enzyme S subunit